MNLLSIKPLLNKKALGMALFGFSAGLPLLLIFSTLSVWLVNAGVERSTITLFSWAGFAYSFKFLWFQVSAQPLAWKASSLIGKEMNIEH